MKRTMGFLLAAMLSIGAGAAIAQKPQPALQKPLLPAPKLVKPKKDLPKNIGWVTGRIYLSNVPNVGCATVQSGTLRFSLDGRPVASGDVELSVFSTGDRYTSGLTYKVKNLPRGRHVLAVSSNRGCSGFSWRPTSANVNLAPPKFNGKQHFRYAIK